METGKLKLALSAGAVALSMALAGCGGSSSSGAAQNPEDEDMTPTVAECVAENQVLQGMACAAECSDNYTANDDGLCVADPPRNLAGGDIAKALRTALVNGHTETGGNISLTETNGSANLVHATRTINFEAAADETDITLKKDMDVSVDPLGDWKGDHYKGSQGSGEAKHTGMLRAYSNKEDPQMVAFTSTAGGRPGLGTLVEGSGYPIDNASDAASHVRGDGFASAGTKTHTAGAERVVPGTYMGASGTYTCSGATCESRWGTGGDITLVTGTWVFAPDQGAMRAVADTQYLEFGWWKREDNDGEATHATAYARFITSGTPALEPVNLGTAHTGSATYTGKAAGLFAISDSGGGYTADSGHFTADAVLEATFSGNATGSELTGNITNFRLDDSSTDPGWSVELQAGDYSVSEDFTGGKTQWTISTGKGSAVDNGWTAAMYNDKGGDGDTSNIPDSVLGTFHSAIGETHQMRGAFGAERP